MDEKPTTQSPQIGYKRKTLKEYGSIYNLVKSSMRMDGLSFNLTTFARADLVLKLEPLIAAKAKGKQIEGGKNKVVQNSAQAESSTAKHLLTGAVSDG